MEPRSEDGQFQDVTIQQLPEDDGGTHVCTISCSLCLAFRSFSRSISQPNEETEDHRRHQRCQYTIIDQEYMHR